MAGEIGPAFVFASDLEPWMFESDFEPTPTLRFLRPAETTTATDRLQQQWKKPTYNGVGHVSGWEYEWRDVPLEIAPASGPAGVNRPPE